MTLFLKSGESSCVRWAIIGVLLNESICGVSKSVKNCGQVLQTDLLPIHRSFICTPKGNGTRASQETSLRSENFLECVWSLRQAVAIKSSPFRKTQKRYRIRPTA